MWLSSVGFSNKCTAPDIFGVLYISLFVAVFQQCASGFLKIQPFTFPPTARTGEKISVTCLAIKGSPPFAFVWMKDGRNITASRNVDVVNNKDFSTIVIDPIDEYSKGNYTCTARDETSTFSYSSLLQVHAPPTWTQEPNGVEIVAGEDITIRCEAKGSPYPRIMWKKLDNTNGVNELLADANGKLLLPAITEEYNGRYMCEAANGVDEPIRKIISITVHGKHGLTTSIPNLCSGVFFSMK